MHMQNRRETGLQETRNGIMEELGSARNHSSQKLWPYLHIRKSLVSVENFLMAFWAIPGIPESQEMSDQDGVVVGHISFQGKKKLFAALRPGEMVVFL